MARVFVGGHPVGKAVDDKVHKTMPQNCREVRRFLEHNDSLPKGSSSMSARSFARTVILTGIASVAICGATSAGAEDKAHKIVAANMQKKLAAFTLHPDTPRG